MKFCSHISEASVLYLLWTSSIITGSRCWIHFFLPFSKGQGNMKLQKSSSLCHIGVSPEGNMAMVFLMPFFSPCRFSTQSLAHLVTAHTVTHSRIAPSEKLLLMNINSTWKGSSHRSAHVMSRGAVLQCLASPWAHSPGHTHAWLLLYSKYRKKVFSVIKHPY